MEIPPKCSGELFRLFQFLQTQKGRMYKSALLFYPPPIKSTLLRYKKLSIDVKARLVFFRQLKINPAFLLNQVVKYAIIEPKVNNT